MATRSGFSGPAVALAAGGGLLIYAGVTRQRLPDALRGLVRGTAVKPASFVKPSSSSSGEGPADTSGGTALGAKIAAAALTQVGKPYRWGATGPDSFDCSGLLYWAIRHAGDPSYPRLATPQIAVSTRFSKISRGEVGAGDVCWKLGHVAIATSNTGMVEAYKTGQPVRTNPIDGRGFTMFLRYLGLKSRSPVP